MSKNILIVGGVLNLFLAVFHIYLGYQIYLITGIAPMFRELLIMLNVGGTLFVILFTVASLAFWQDMLTTQLGKLLILFVVLLYASRAIEEIFVTTHFSAPIFGVCLFIAAVYFVLLILPVNKQVSS